jgi:hypothetical protein
MLERGDGGLLFTTGYSAVKPRPHMGNVGLGDVWPAQLCLCLARGPGAEGHLRWNNGYFSPDDPEKVADTIAAHLRDV